MSDGGSTATAAAVAIGNAIKASGAIVRVEPSDFMRILARSESPLVVCATGGFFSTSYRYLTGYKGMVFFTKTPTALDLPPETELVQASKISIPD